MSRGERRITALMIGHKEDAMMYWWHESHGVPTHHSVRRS
jgi:hypothetical protein